MRDRDDSPLVAGQVADLNETLTAMRDTMAKRVPAQVTVHVPETPVTVKVPENIPPNLHFNFAAPEPTQVKFDVPQLPPPVVKVDAPVVNVLPPVARAYNVRITERDQDGFILAFVITPA
jgi:hypothetical protein